MTTTKALKKLEWQFRTCFLFCLHAVRYEHGRHYKHGKDHDAYLLDFHGVAPTNGQEVEDELTNKCLTVVGRESCACLVIFKVVQYDGFESCPHNCPTQSCKAIEDQYVPAIICKVGEQSQTWSCQEADGAEPHNRICATAWN